MSNSAVFVLSGGIITAISVSKGVEIVIKDYDQDDIDPELLRIDKDGGRYVETVYTSYRK